jgi:dihydrofolate synthase / folylpolyglutamate synthase
LATYTDTLDYLFFRLPMFHRIGAAAYKKDLTNTILLCKHLQQPQTKFKTIHIAGTNGKGSVSHMLAAVLQQAGYKTGLYTSPHLYDFRERIKINGQPVIEDFVVSFTERVKPMIEEIHPSFFEITVAMAFEYFAQQEVAIAVIETGLGGRLDSTNIITPELSIITNIGYDHMNLLGDTLEAIAAEKAGIIKPGIPVVIGETLPETRPVFEQAATAKKSTLLFAEGHCDIQRVDHDSQQLCVQTTRNKEMNEYGCDLTGHYQVKNIRTVLCALDVLQQQGFHITGKHIQQGLENAAALTGLQGRWEKIHRNPDIILDVAHNEDGIRQLLPVLDARKENTVHIVMGMVKDKEADKILALLPQYATYYFTQADIPRALDKELLMEMAAANGLHGTVFEDVNLAIKSAREKATATDLILIIGSVFLVGEVNRDEIANRLTSASDGLH